MAEAMTGYATSNAAQRIAETEKTGALSQDEKREIYHQEGQNVANISKFAVAASSMAMGLDVNTAINSADNALQNNFLPGLIAVAYVAQAAYSTYEIANAYQEDGVEGAAKQGVIEAGLAYTGLGLVKMAGKGLGIAGKIASKTATGEALLTTGSNALSKAANAAAPAVESFNKTQVGTLLNQADKAVLSAQSAVTSAVTKSAGKIGQAITPKAFTAHLPNSVTESFSVSQFEKVHGKKAIQNMTDMELAQSLANRAERKFSHLPATRQSGTVMHKYNEKLFKRYQDLYKTRNDVVVETRFKDGVLWEAGMGVKGSVIPDFYNTRTGIAYDYKYFNAIVTKNQVKRYQAALPNINEKQAINVVQIKPNNEYLKK